MKPFEATKAVWIEWRRPQTKTEKKRFGESVVNGTTARIFINVPKCRTSKEMEKTFWHEMVHVFAAFHKTGWTEEQEDAMAYRVENVLWEVMR